MERLQRLLVDPLNQCVTIVAWLVDHPRHRIGVKCDAGACFKDSHDLPRVRDLCIKPIILQLPLKNDRHAVVEMGHELIRVFRDDGEGVEFFTVGLGPDVVQAGEGNVGMCIGVDVVGRFVAAITLPLCYIGMSSR